MAKQKEKNQPVPANAFDDVILGWLAPAYLRFERGWLWFVLVFGFSALLVWYAFLTDSLTMAALFGILPFVLVLEHRKKPQTVEVIFSHYGIKFGELKIPYSGVKAFWILHNPPFVDELHLKTDRKVHPEVVIPLMGTHPAFIRQYLVTQVIEWEGKELSFLDALVRILRLS